MIKAALILLSSLAIQPAELASLRQVGETQLRVLWFDVYKAALFSPTGHYHGTRAPLLLKLHYQRDISQHELLKETARQLNGKAKREEIDEWLAQLDVLWPDIRDGDELWFYMQSESRGSFFYQGRYLGTVDRPRFAKAFIDIWLSEESEYPRRARQLRGESS